MNADYRLKTTKLLAVLGVLAIVVTGCGARGAYNRGIHAEVMKNFDTAMTEFKIAFDKDPGNIEYRLKFEQSRYNAAFAHFDAGGRALETNDFETAKAEFSRVLEIDPSHVLAQEQLAKVNAVLDAKSRGAVEPDVQFDEMRQATRTDPSVQAQLEPRVTGPIDIH